ncbi:MAG: tail fiber domain-containing protein [Chloroflexota bacterium]
MDSRSFDRFAAALGAASTRRAGIAAAIAAAVGRGVAPDPAAAGPGAASPCGKRKTSTCKTDGDCCSGRCERSKGDTNLDGLGRCRCSRRGQACTDEKDCCSGKNQGLVCTAGICSRPCTSLGSTCDGTRSCCAGACTSFVFSERGIPASGPICCLAVGQRGCAKDADCCGAGSSIACVAGTCSTTCTAIGEACTGQTCCAPASCGANAIDRANPEAQAPVCCLPNNAGPCTSNGQCCSNICNGGICSLPPSDVRLKERIEPLLDGLGIVEALRPVRWDWTEASGLQGMSRIGFIAQEVQQVAPEVVGPINLGGGDPTGDGAYLGIDYAKLVAVLTGAIQEQQAEISALRARLDAMETTAGDHCRQA